MSARRTDELDTGQMVQVGIIYRPVKTVSRNADRTFTVTLGAPVVATIDTPTRDVQATRLWITTPPDTYGPTDPASGLATQPLR